MGCRMVKNPPADLKYWLKCRDVVGTAADRDARVKYATAADIVPAVPGKGTPSSLRIVLCPPSQATR
jgi:hypothetical protein